MAGRLAGKTAVITGSTAGIGRASAELFAAEGAAVIICDDGSRAGLGDRVAEDIRRHGGRALYCRADVTRRKDIERLITVTVDTYNRLDILMNNAACGTSGPVLEQDEAEWDRTFESSVKACFLAAKTALPHMMRAGGGAIVNTASVHGLLAGRGAAAYDAAKSAIINLTRQIAVDYGRYGIRANALCPGRILTEAKNTWLTTHPEEQRRQAIVYPLGRPGTMREAAMAALFLASDESSFVTGHALVVDGGLTASLQDATGSLVDEWWMQETSGEHDP